MDNFEFEQWFKYHCSTFDSVRKWSDKLSESELDMALKQWRKILGNYSSHLCMKATGLMLENSEGQPHRIEQHPGRIKRLIEAITGYKTKNYQIENGEFTYKCLICRDEGWIEVRLSGKAYTKALELWGRESADRASCVVACTCDNRFNRKNVPYDKDKMVRVDDLVPTRLASTERVKETMNLLKRLHDNKVSRKDYIQSLLKWEKEHPGEGWGLTAKALQDVWGKESEYTAAGANLSSEKAYLNGIDIEDLKVPF